MQKISIYSNIKDTKSEQFTTVDLLLAGIKDGKWQDEVLPVRTVPSRLPPGASSKEIKAARTELKKRLPNVTISGYFANERVDGKITQHSGLIALDFDNLADPEGFKDTIAQDRHTYAAFISVSGTGVCALWKIDGSKHRLAFGSIQEYLRTNGLPAADPSGVNESRARFVSYDPSLYWNEEAVKFTSYTKPKEIKHIPKVIYAENDFQHIIRTIHDRNLCLADTYHEWLRMGFALAHKFGESGRGTFHEISSHSSKYSEGECDKQYDHCLKGAAKDGVTIGTFYHYVKQAGIPFYSEETKLIASTASNLKKAGLSKEAIIKNLEQHSQIPAAVSAPIVTQIVDHGVELEGVGSDSKIPEIEVWLRSQYDLRTNTLTGYVENNGIPLEEKALNSIFIAAKKIFNQNAPTATMKELIHSEFTPTYSPLLDFFRENQLNIPEDPQGAINALWATVTTDNPAYLVEFGTKWLVSLIAAAHGQHSPLMLILTGEQGTGKTEFFRRLLPPQLSQYYAESKLNSGKDDHILMTQRWLILDDEISGKSKKEEDQMKSLLSAQEFSLRKPYGSGNVTLRRLAVLAGTSNKEQVLADPTGNRRFIPARFISCNFREYNAINKTQLIMAAYALYKQGFKWEVTREDAIRLNEATQHFEQNSMEQELILRHYTAGKNGFGEWVTVTDIKVYLEGASGQKLRSVQIGQEMDRLGFFSRRASLVAGISSTVYLVVKVSGISSGLDVGGAKPF